jgi:LuxR family maltose regulon positive regulatory protein
MGSPWQSLIVPTRFTPPRILTNIVARSKLLAQLESFSSCKVILVTAGAGFGKTTLMAQWNQHLAASGDDVAWLTLGKGEGDLRNFLAYLFKSLQHAGVDLGHALFPSFISGDAEDARAMVGILVNVLAEHPKNVHLIIDDIHHLSDPVAHETLRNLLEQSTDNFRITMAGRSLPAIPLSRLRIGGQVGDVASPALSFDVSETAEFLKTGVPERLSQQQLQRAHEIFHGWPAGMQLLRHALNQYESWESLVDLLRRNTGFREYISENVLANLDADQVVFLERLSAVPRFCAELAEAVTEKEDAEERILQLARMHMFVSRFDMNGGDTWYQLHPLFANVLNARLGERPTEVSRCHTRAAEWFAVNGFLLDSVGHAKAAGNTASITNLIESSPMSLKSLSQLGSVRRLADEIDPTSLPANSKLLSLGAWSFLLTAQLRQAMRWLDCIDPALGEECALQRRIIEAGVALYQDNTQRILDLVGDLDPSTIEQPFLRQCLATELITAYQAIGRFDNSERVIAVFIQGLLHEQDEMALIVEALKTVSLLTLGDAVAAEQHGLRIVRRAETSAGPRSVSAAVAAAFLADAQYELHKLEEARATLAGRSDMVYYSPPDPLARAVVTQVRLAAYLNGPMAAANLLSEAIPRFQVRGSDRALALLLQEQLRLKLLVTGVGSTTSTMHMLEQLADRNIGAEGYLAEISYIWAIAQAQVALADSRALEALVHLEAASKKCMMLNRVRVQASVALLTAQAHAALKHTFEADAAAQQAINLCEAGGLRQTIVDHGHDVVAMLLARAYRLRISQELLTFLKAASADTRGGAPLSANGEGTSKQFKPTLDKLTPREIEVIRLLGQSMSNKRIAAALGIAPSTVKWNLQNIFLKLGLSTRYDVITWMREAGAATG